MAHQRFTALRLRPRSAAASPEGKISYASNHLSNALPQPEKVIVPAGLRRLRWK